jgi:hypothetical protein
MLRRVTLLLLVVLVLAPAAHAGGGNYVFDGGTRGQQQQVRAALNASSFDWGVVPGPVMIHIGARVSPHATAGEIWLDARLLDAGRFAWGVVQHEYAHQVDFAVLTDATRARLHEVLGGSSWWGELTSHPQLDCERFADALAYAYWPSSDNVVDGSRVSPQAFRAALDAVLAPLGVKPRPRKG